VFRFLLSRLYQAVFVVGGVMIVVFLVLHLTGDPASLLLPPGSSEQDVQVIRHEYGLDKPLPVQLFRFLFGDVFAAPAGGGSAISVASYGVGNIRVAVQRTHGAVAGDFGTSLRFIGQPAMPIVLERLPLTVQLMVAAALYSTVFSLVFGTMSAVRPYSWLDRIVRSFAILNQSIPNFWMGLLLILVFSVYLGALPAMGYGSWEYVILPAITLGSQSLGRNTRVVRSSVLESLSQDYVRTARAKGLSGWIVLSRHVLRNALAPMVTLWGLDVGILFGGAVITESIFGWPGMGRLIIESVSFRDFPTVEAAVFFMAVVFVGVNLLVDLSYAWLDPRVAWT
jgi:ABC-type dipeptide/oligopeptide/nickel transport system permease component